MQPRSGRHAHAIYGSTFCLIPYICAGATWKGHAHAAKAAGAQDSNDFLYAQRPDYIPAAGNSSQHADPSLYMPRGLHAAAVPYQQEEQLDSQGAEGAESISGSIDLPCRCLLGQA